ncbi:MAG: hypothetical protein JWM46_176 [Candidatus Kaiserbacteria bacterium]|nr:hypothetical protein [Candidatus Kaiserbacteria bacterium]
MPDDDTPIVDPKSPGLNDNHSQTYTNDPDRRRGTGEKTPGVSREAQAD